jgi:hypothetical protein
VVLAVDPKENRLEIPALGQEFLALSLGIEYSPRALKAGRLGEVTVTQRTAAPKIDREKRCYEVESVVAGGFTLEVDAEAGWAEPRT